MVGARSELSLETRNLALVMLPVTSVEANSETLVTKNCSCYECCVSINTSMRAWDYIRRYTNVDQD